MASHFWAKVGQLMCRTLQSHRAKINLVRRSVITFTHLWYYVEWLVFIMMTSSNENIFRVAGPLCGEFTDHQWIPRTKATNAELWYCFDLGLNERLSKQSWGWWFEKPSRQLWRQSNVPASWKVSWLLMNHWENTLPALGMTATSHERQDISNLATNRSLSDSVHGWQRASNGKSVHVMASSSN